MTQTKSTMTLNTIPEAIADIKAGKIIIVVDDEDRENEGDFICAADCVTPEIINFMATHGRGLICSPIEEKRAEDLELEMMVNSNTALHNTAFTVSIDLVGHGCSTGISAYDRATGIRALSNPNTKPSDFARPGHIFPLKAKTGGVLRRTGHTEAAIDLAKLAGYSPVGVLVEILNADGTMARLPDLIKIAEEFDLKIISIADLVAYRMQNERIIKRELTTSFETKLGTFELTAYRQITSDDVHIAIKKGSWNLDEPVMVRVQNSNHILSPVLPDFGCDIMDVLKQISEEGKGVLILMRHGDKNEDIIEVLKNLNKPDPNYSNAMELRDFGVGAQIIRDLSVSKIRLLSNSAPKNIALEGYGIEIVENVKLK